MGSIGLSLVLPAGVLAGTPASPSPKRVGVRDILVGASNSPLFTSPVGTFLFPVGIHP